MFSSLKKGAYPENSHPVFCPNKKRSFEPFTRLALVLERQLSGRQQKALFKLTQILFIPICTFPDRLYFFLPRQDDRPYFFLPRQDDHPYFFLPRQDDHPYFFLPRQDDHPYFFLPRQDDHPYFFLLRQDDHPYFFLPSTEK